MKEKKMLLGVKNAFTLPVRHIAHISFLAVGIVALSASAHAGVNLVVNGGFEQTQTSLSSEFGSRFPAQQVTGWTTDGYNFVFRSGTADTTGANSEYGPNDVSLHGPVNGSSNGLPASSPNGGNFIAADGAYITGPISQVINGLTPGQLTNVSFYWAGAQQFGYDGVQTEQWAVSLGSDTQYTSVFSNVSHGFSGWMPESFAFTPTSSTETLSFLAIGTPTGVPPFSLLDGVDVEATPEPSVWGMGIAGFGALVIAARFRRKSSLKA